MSVRLENIPDDVVRFQPTPFGRLELIRHDFDYAKDLGDTIDFFDVSECDVIKNKKVKIKKEDGNEEEKKEIKMDRLAVIMEMRQMIKKLTGFKLEHLIHEANNGTSGNDPDHAALKGLIRGKIFENEALPFFSRYNLEAQAIAFEELGMEANAIFDKLRSNRCYQNAQKLGMLNEIRSCHDPAQLLLIALDERVSDDDPETKAYAKRKRFEAKRKLLAMLDVAEAKGKCETQVNHKNAQAELTDFLFRNIVFPDKVKLQYLVANFNENGQVIDGHFRDTKEGIEKKEHQIVKEFLARIVREKKDGEQITTIMDDRIKEIIDLVLKAYDANTDILSRDVDRNGQLFTFKSREEWDYVFSGLIEKLKEEIAVNTHKRMMRNPNNLNNLESDLTTFESLLKAQLVKVRRIKKDGTPGEIYGMYLSTVPVENGEILSKDPEAFFTNLAAKAGDAVSSPLYKELAKSILDTIVIYEVKDTLEGGKFKASREGDSAGSPDLEVLKLKMEIRGSDEKREIRHYEFQVYLPKGFAGAKFGLEASHEYYSIKRAKKIGMVYWPEDIYGFDHQQGQNEAFEELAKERGFVLVEDFISSQEAIIKDISTQVRANEVAA